MHGGHAHLHADSKTATSSSKDRERRGLLIALLTTGGFMIAELVGGLLSGSLALLSDAGHMLTDAVALAMAYVAAWIASRPPSARRSYGFERAEVLSALFNASALLVASVFVIIEALERLAAPPKVEGKLALVIASIGLGINLFNLSVLGAHSHHGHGCEADDHDSNHNHNHNHDHRHEHEHEHEACDAASAKAGQAGSSRAAKESKPRRSMNLQGALLHVLGDTLGSVAAIVSAICVWLWDWRLADPLASLVIVLLIIASALNLLWRSIDVLMESVPAHIDPAKIDAALRGVAGVEDLHDLHIWSLSGHQTLLTAHVVTACEEDGQELLARLTAVLETEFGIKHSTLQLERSNFNRHHHCT